MLLATVLLPAENAHYVSASGMERVDDLHLKSQTPGIVTLARAAGEKAIYQQHSVLP